MNGRRRLIGSFVHGTMANALPQAIGAQAAYPGRQVVALSGDGGLAMLLGELLTLRQQRLPVKVVVFNNGALAFVELEMKAAGIVNFGTDLDNPDFAAVARAIGLHGVRVEQPAELDGRPARGVRPRRPGPRRRRDRPPGALDAAAHHRRARPTGFALWATRSVLSGSGDQVVELAAPTCASSKASRRGVGEPGDHGAAAAPHEKAPAAHWLPGPWMFREPTGVPRGFAFDGWESRGRAPPDARPLHSPVQAWTSCARQRAECSWAEVRLGDLHRPRGLPFRALRTPIGCCLRRAHHPDVRPSAAAVQKAPGRYASRSAANCASTARLMPSWTPSAPRRSRTPSLASTLRTEGLTRARLSRTPALSTKSRISASVAAPWESTKSTPSMSRTTARSGGSASCASPRTRSSSASAVAKNRPPSSRTTA